MEALEKTFEVRCGSVAGLEEKRVWSALERVAEVLQRQFIKKVAFLIGESLTDVIGQIEREKRRVAAVLAGKRAWLLRAERCIKTIRDFDETFGGSEGAAARISILAEKLEQRLALINRINDEEKTLTSIDCVALMKNLHCVVDVCARLETEL